MILIGIIATLNFMFHEMCAAILRELETAQKVGACFCYSSIIIIIECYLMEQMIVGATYMYVHVPFNPTLNVLAL